MFELNYIFLPDDNKSTFELKKSIALINGNQWLINPNNETDHFFVFDNLTMVPIDKDLIDQAILNESEKSWINKYHNKVFKNLRNFMDKVELSELQKACSAI